MASPYGIMARPQESGGSGVPSALAKNAYDVFDDILQDGSKPLYAANAAPNCVSIVEPERVDAITTMIFGVFHKACIKYDPANPLGFAEAICALADKSNPIFCGPSSEGTNIPEHKKIWLQTDAKKLLILCELESDDCCDDLSVWIEISGGANIGDEAETQPELVSMETPSDASGI